MTHDELCEKCGHDAFAIAKDALSHQMPSAETIRRFDSIASMAKIITTILVSVIIAGIGAQWKITDRSIAASERVIVTKIENLDDRLKGHENKINIHDEKISILENQMSLIYPFYLKNND